MKRLITQRMGHISSYAQQIKIVVFCVILKKCIDSIVKNINIVFGVSRF